MKKYGFIGCGNMGGALALALSKTVSGDNIFLANKTAKKAEDLAVKTGGRVTDNKTVAKDCDVIFLGVKPQMMEGMLEDIKPVLLARDPGDYVLVTMAAALTIADIRSMAGGKARVLRIMPNTPVSVGEGIILYSYDDTLEKETAEEIIDALKAAGECVNLPEKLIDAGSAVAGCGPAFAQIFIEALADGGVACGLPRDKATRLAAGMLKGSATLTLTSGKTPGELKDAVCSPGGSTIEGVRALEEKGFRGAAMDAVSAAYEKTLKMKK
ncbi:MAG: pyrroline-5-carboxylate reductase [Lachnospiraceae bacterium]|nr:pyrroline-5-carboxylate reductase [Lachnospiraceae bacterium]